MLATAVLAAGCKRRHEAIKLYREGQQVFRYQGDPVRAEPIFLKALEIDPSLTHAHVELADLYASGTNTSEGLYSLDKAMKHLREVIRLAPDHIGAHYRMGRVALKKGDLALTQQEFEATRRLLDRHFGLGDGLEWRQLLLYEGLVLLDRGDISGAEAKFRRYNSYERRISRLSVIGLMLVAAARGDKAEFERREKELSLLAQPSDSVAYQGLVYIWKGMPGKGAAVLEKRLAKLKEQIPEDRNSIYYETYAAKQRFYRKILAWAYQKAGREEEARTLFPGQEGTLSPSKVEIVRVFFGGI